MIDIANLSGSVPEEEFAGMPATRMVSRASRLTLVTSSGAIDMRIVTKFTHYATCLSN
ncbi:hypothetical protein GCM10010911_34120 [Paenibacillus nasutitermitis]|uniref:Uncharacterized protein n=1 Tax=Paenibacillus nasutitermitis TaxID=1652958 RepID=A0A916Z2U5_9BACL|nr:hypothetical protein GCM10010911_34120 [Paenibacillus nasutitermitis]